MNPIITVDVLQKLAPGTSLIRLQAVNTAINKVCPMYGLYTVDILHEFIATLLEESKEFKSYVENLNYSAARLCEVWKSRFPTLAAAKPYANNPQALAGKVYDFRKDLGNTIAGEGWALRGSGPIQITGKDMIKRFAAYMQQKYAIVHTVIEWAELIRTNDEMAMHSACWVFAIAKGLIDEAVNDQMGIITKKINGSLTNMVSRIKYLNLCRLYIVEPAA